MRPTQKKKEASSSCARPAGNAMHTVVEEEEEEEEEEEVDETRDDDGEDVTLCWTVLLCTSLSYTCHNGLGAETCVCVSIGQETMGMERTRRANEQRGRGVS